MKFRVALAFAVSVLFTSYAFSQERPSEDSLFGDPQPAPVPQLPPQQAPQPLPPLEPRQSSSAPVDLPVPTIVGAAAAIVVVVIAVVLYKRK